MAGIRKAIRDKITFIRHENECQLSNNTIGIFYKCHVCKKTGSVEVVNHNRGLCDHMELEVLYPSLTYFPGGQPLLIEKILTGKMFSIHEIKSTDDHEILREVLSHNFDNNFYPGWNMTFGNVKKIKNASLKELLINLYNILHRGEFFESALNKRETTSVPREAVKFDFIKQYVQTSKFLNKSDQLWTILVKVNLLGGKGLENQRCKDIINEITYRLNNRL